MANLAGVDGCRGVWVVAMGKGWPPASEIEVRVCGSFREVLVVTNKCDAIAIDVPMGLPQARVAVPPLTTRLLSPKFITGVHARLDYYDPGLRSLHRWHYSPPPWPRDCDLTVRNLLGSRGKSRVFLAPPRETLRATDPKSFQKLHLETTGVKAALPVWGILSKIREVDSCMSPGLQERVFEFYPELVWMDLSEEKKALSSKHTKEGIAARIDLLRKSGLSIDPYWLTIQKKWLMKRTSFHNPVLKQDDLLDAIAGLKAAKDFFEFRMTCSINLSSIRSSLFPKIPRDETPIDMKGLRMEIWY